MSTLSTHILNTTTGTPAPDVQILLTRVVASPPAADLSAVGSRATPQAEGVASGAGDGSLAPPGLPDPGETAITSPRPTLSRPLDPPLPSADSAAVGSTVTRQFEVLASGQTDSDGRVAGFGELVPGVYQLWFEVARDGQESFYPEVTVTFVVTEERHYHVPLLLSPFAFSTYRGS
ncbi:hydroxyisourate hydrolase [Kribbella sp. CA-294648]|uniref:hydroxyisourate hydrolase n=1 Tax=Kribbella sp. CA-294648 TaxID=3239948 RepID=UPI003D90C1BF